MTTFMRGYKGPMIDPMIDPEGFRKLVQSNPPDPRIPVVGATPPPPRGGKGFPIRPGVKPTVTGAPATPITPKPMGGLPRTRPPRDIGTGAPATPITPKPAPKPSLVNPSRPKPIVTPKKQAMGFGGGLKKGGSVSSASKRADGIATKGKTKGKIV